MKKKHENSFKSNRRSVLLEERLVLQLDKFFVPFYFISTFFTGADELAGLKLPKWNLTFSPEKVEKLQQFNFTEVNVTLNCVENCNLIDDPGSLQLDLTNEKANIASLQVKVCNYEICMNKQWQREPYENLRKMHLMSDNNFFLI